MKKKQKGIIVTVLVFISTIYIAVFPTFAAGQWKRDSIGWWYEYGSGEFAQNQWEKIDGLWYRFDERGYMQTNWVLDNHLWYYLRSDGSMYIGWLKDGERWYYLRESGAMHTGWLKENNTWYYLNASGAMQTGWLKEGDYWYYLNTSGAMQTGWIYIENIWYYLSGVGTLVTQTITPDAYPVGKSGAWIERKVQKKDLQSISSTNHFSALKAQYKQFVQSDGYIRLQKVIKEYAEVLTNKNPNLASDLRNKIIDLLTIDLFAEYQKDNPLIRFHAQELEILRIQLIYYGNLYLDAFRLQEISAQTKILNELLNKMREGATHVQEVSALFN